MGSLDGDEAQKGDGEAASLHAQVDTVFTLMPGAFVPDRAGSWASVIVFEVTGTGDYTVTIAGGTCTVSKGRPDAPSCTINYDSTPIFLDTMSGKVKAEQAFMAGKIKADNIGDLMTFSRCFDMKKAAPTGPDEHTPPVREGLNRDLVGRTWRISAARVRREDTIAYAHASNDLNPRYLSGQVAPPIYPARHLYAVATEVVTDPELNADLLRLVHGEQDMIFHDVIRPGDLLTPRATITGIESKGSGELISVVQRLFRHGEVVCEVNSGYFVRSGAGSGKKKAGGAAASETRALLFESSYVVDEDQSYRYAAVSLDNNPIHVDHGVAQAAGHPGVILHGLCTMAMACREVVDTLCQGDPARLARFKLRFTRIVLPGDTLTTRAWLESEDSGARVVGLETVNQRGDRVLGRAKAYLRAAQ